tara:strand:- start:437 stop:688 length:252 start_codon:yes stop_codon:yes gene_type:complete
MRLLGITVSLMGLFLFVSGLIFLDMASMVLKKDIYTIDILGLTNNLFSLDPTVAVIQSGFSLLMIIMGSVASFGGGIIYRAKS